MDNLSLAHSRDNCTCYIIFISNYRREMMFVASRKDVGEIPGKRAICEGEHGRRYVTIFVLINIFYIKSNTLYIISKIGKYVVMKYF